MDPRIQAMLTEELLEAICSRYGLEKDELTLIGGYQNFIFGYERGSRSYILRLTPGTLRTPELIEAELEWIHDLSRHGVPVSRPVTSAGGQSMAIIRNEQLTFTAVSFERAPGRRIHYPECLHDAQLIERCGRLTGQIHRLSRDYRPLNRRHEWHQNDYLVNAISFIPSDQQLVHEQIKKLLLEVDQLRRDDDCYGLIHGDINIGNFMVDEHGALTLFDFDECQYSWYVEDIAVQLYYMVYVFGDDVLKERKKQCDFFMEHFMRGYRDETALSDEWLKRLPLFLRLREVIVYAGMHRSYDMTKLDDWTRDYLTYSRSRIEQGLSIVEGNYE